MKLFVNDENASREALIIASFSSSKIEVINSASAGSETVPSQLPAFSNEISGLVAVSNKLVSDFAPQLTASSQEHNHWVNFRLNCLNDAESSKNNLQTLNNELSTKVFLCNNQLSIADIHIFAVLALNKTIESLNKTQRVQFCNVVRWFDNLQHFATLRNSTFISLPVVAINKNLTPQEAEKAKSETKATPTPTTTTSTSTSTSTSSTSTTTSTTSTSTSTATTSTPVVAEKPQAPQKQQKSKNPEQVDAKQNKRAPKQQAKAAPAENRSDLSHLNMVVGRILSVKRHPDATNLFVESIDLGEAEPRTICSGLVKFMNEEDLQDRLVVVLANLKPRAMRGITSQGMLLCVENADETKAELVQPPEGTPVGERISFAGHEGPADAALNPKHKHWENTQPQLITSADFVCNYQNIPFMTSRGPCTCKSLVGGKIK